MKVLRESELRWVSGGDYFDSNGQPDPWAQTLANGKDATQESGYYPDGHNPYEDAYNALDPITRDYYDWVASGMPHTPSDNSSSNSNGSVDGSNSSNSYDAAGANASQLSFDTNGNIVSSSDITTVVVHGAPNVIQGSGAQYYFNSSNNPNSGVLAGSGGGSGDNYLVVQVADTNIVDSVFNAIVHQTDQVQQAAAVSEKAYQEKHTVNYDNLKQVHYLFESLFTAKFFEDTTTGRMYLDRDGNGKIDGEVWVNSQGQAVYDDNGDHVADGVFTGIVAGA